jgi:hypothetical protein
MHIGKSYLFPALLKEQTVADEPITEPLDLRQFLDGVEAATDDENGFDLNDILAVEEAWEQDDDGEVIQDHQSGRRNGSGAHNRAARPRQGKAGPQPHAQGVYWYKPDHITTHLYTLHPDAGAEDADS